MKINKTLTALIAGASIGISGQAFSAAAPLTEAGTEITNSVTLDYSVDGQDQVDVPSAGLSFLVDTKVDFTLILQETSAIPVTPGKEYAAAYLLTNTGNSAIEFSLGAANAVDATTLTVGSDALVDNIDFSGLSVVGQSPYDTAGATPVIPYAGTEPSAATTTIAANYAQVVYAVATAAGTDSNHSVISLTATASQSTDKVGMVTSTADDNRGVAFNPSVVQIVFADSGSNGNEAADSGFKVVSAEFTHDDGVDPEANGPGLTVTVINDTICEPTLDKDSTADHSGGCTITDSRNFADDANRGTTHFPKAIPGAMVKYTITANNTGNAPAEGVTFLQNLLTSHGDGVNLQAGSLNNVSVSFFDSTDSSTTDVTATVNTGTTTDVLFVDFDTTDIAVGDTVTITFTAIAE